ncbi:internal scaffolding protein [Microviridae sp.]|nr:internal scaffolding protein [Microviridae sp.]
MKNKIKTQWDRKRHYAEQSDEMVTEQSHAPGCNLHLILNRYTKTGQLPIGNTRGQAQFMDCPDEAHDFKTNLDTIKRAESEFYRLPLEEQRKHNDNPSEWLRGVLSEEFLNDPADTEAPADEAEGLSEASQNVLDNGGKEAQSDA